MQKKQKIILVVVSYNRSAMLRGLLKSISLSRVLPWRVVVVNNASTDDTVQVLQESQGLFPEGCLMPVHLGKNTGGAGGFSEGVRQAMAMGAEWMWLMDDDVEVMPDGLERLLKWGETYQCIHGRRYDFNGTPFFWQPVFNQWLGVPLPYLSDPFKQGPVFKTNSGCFEGMFVHRDIVRQIGLPDPRFFITWDDAMYGWLASRITDVAYVDDFVMRRAREQKQINLGVRHLNDASDLFRFHVIRNRAYVAHYLKHAGVFSPVGFFVGGLLNFGKEIVRMLLVEHSFKGLPALLRGVREGRKIMRDTSWQPMPSLKVN